MFHVVTGAEASRWISMDCAWIFGCQCGPSKLLFWSTISFIGESRTELLRVTVILSRYSHYHPTPDLGPPLLTLHSGFAFSAFVPSLTIDLSILAVSKFSSDEKFSHLHGRWYSTSEKRSLNCTGKNLFWSQMPCPSPVLLCLHFSCSMSSLKLRWPYIHPQPESMEAGNVELSRNAHLSQVENVRGVFSSSNFDDLQLFKLDNWCCVLSHSHNQLDYSYIFRHTTSPCYLLIHRSVCVHTPLDYMMYVYQRTV